MSEQPPGSGDPAQRAPVALRVLRGQPAPDELAALLAVVASRAAGAATPADPAPPSAWAGPVGRLPAPLPTPGSASWRRSMLPR